MKPVAEMSELEKAQIRAWFRNWAEVGHILDEVRAEEIRNADTVRSMEILDGMFDDAARSQPARETSGLVEQQTIFARAKR